MDINVDIIFKIAAIGIIVAVLNQVLIRAGREDQAMMTTLAGIIVVLLLIVHMINNFFITVKTLFQF
jgi:stage III sporulation protein AC